jgi:hypothetical protein
MYTPSQLKPAPGIPLLSVSFTGSKLSFTIGEFGGAISFVGTLSEDGNSIEGWFQDVPLKLERSGQARHAARSPAETPAAPAPTLPEMADPSELLSRALEKLAGTEFRLLKYMCIETVQRVYYSDRPQKPGSSAMTEISPGSCAAVTFTRDGRARIDAEDRLRLQVAVSGGALARNPADTLEHARERIGCRIRHRNRETEYLVILT